MRKQYFIVIMFVFAAFTLMFTGCGKVVPPGTTVLVLKADGPPSISHEGMYKAWGRDKVYFIDTKLASFPKKLNILCADEINMSVSTKWVGSFKVTDGTIDTIKKKVPAEPTDDSDEFRLSLVKFFRMTMEDILSGATRDIVSKYKTDNIREKREEIRETVKAKFLQRMKELKYPIETTDVLITNLDYPKNVTTMRNKIKNAELKDLENQAIAKANVAKAKRDAELALERGKAKLVQAQADAAANEARGASLTPAILAVKQLEVLAQLAQGPNNTAVVIPFDAIRPGGMQDIMLNREAIDRINAPKG